MGREQYQWRWVVLMAALALVLTIGQHRAHHGSGVSAAEWMAKAMVWPVQQLMVNVGGVARNVTVATFAGSRLARENAQLRQRVKELENDKSRMNHYYLENKALKEKLGFELPGKPPGIAARVVGWSSSANRRRITIRAGKGRELEAGRVVVTAAGLVGRIVSAQGRYAEVVLLIEPGHAVAGIVERPPRDQGMVYPAPESEPGDNMLALSKVRRGSDIRVGDEVFSSGLGGVYPPDLRIGTVERVERSAFSGTSIVAILQPFVDFNHLDYVDVLPRAE